jgi:serine dehydrogenase proteinase
VPRYYELTSKPQHGPARFENRQTLLRSLEAKTGRPVVVYAANLNVSNIPNSLDHSDVTPFADLTRTIPGSSIDVLLHSPGGLAEAAERIVSLLRARFTSVRFIIPHSAFSAATMLALSGDDLVLDDTSALGPIDPQIVFRDPQTGQTSIVPTQAILEAFENAKGEIKADPEALGVYLPLLNKLDLALFEMCKNANKLSESLVTEWLKKYLLKDDGDPAAHAKEVTEYLSKHKDRLSHGRPITLETLKNELKISHVVDLKYDPELRDLVGELWAEIEWFIETASAAKFFENAYGVGFHRKFQIQQQIATFLPFPLPQPGPQPEPAPPSSAPAPVPAPPAQQPPAPTVEARREPIFGANIRDALRIVRNWRRGSDGKR